MIEGAAVAAMVLPLSMSESLLFMLKYTRA